MTNIRWNPYREVASLQDCLNTLFLEPSRTQAGKNDPLATAGFVPAVDVYQDEHKIVLKLEVPGIRQENLDVQVENKTLTVRGERKFDSEEKKENFHRIERRYGSFVRAFTLPTSVDEDSVQAHYDAGVLKVELNKRAEAKPKQIRIGIGTPVAD